MDQNLRPNAGGVIVTRFNYHRPKWFGGFFGNFKDHNNVGGNCKYIPEEMERILSAQQLNKLAEPIYLLTPVLAYHLAITIFLALSVLILAMQQGFNYLIEFGFVTSIGTGYLQTLGIIQYITWALGVFTIVPLYYVTLHNVERFFNEGNHEIFTQLGVTVKVNKRPQSKFLLIPGFKRIDSLQICKV